MAFFSAYFDASGTRHGGDAFTVGGGVSRVEKWATLETEWYEHLGRYGLDMLHMKTLVRDLPSKQQRDKLLLGLSGLVKRYVNKTICQSIWLRDWRQTNKRFKLVEGFGNPYPFCGFACVAHVQAWADKRGVELGDIEILFEDGDEHRGELKELCSRQFGITVVFDGKKRMPFQVGDLVAWAGRRESSEYIQSGSVPNRPWVDEIQRVADASRYFSQVQLAELCVQSGVEPRPMEKHNVRQR